MKKEHETLKEICDLIGHEEDCIKYAEWEFWYEGEFYKNYTWNGEVDVREIIFTPEFNNKMLDYLDKNQSLENKMTYALWLMNNLYNPVQYLYNLLELWQNKN